MGAGSAALPLAEPEGAVLRAPSSPRNPPPPWYSSAVFEFRPPLCAPSALPRLPTGTASSHSVSSVCPHILPCVTSPRPLPTHPPTSPLRIPSQCPNVPPCAHCPLPVSPNPAPRPLPASPPHCPHRVPSLPPSFLSAPHPRTSPTSPPVPVCIFQEGAPTALWGQRDVVPRATPRALCTRCPQTAAMFPMVGGCDAVTPWPRVSDKGGQRPLTPWVAAVIGVKGGGQHPPRTLPSTHTLKWDHGERAAVGLGGSWGGTVTPIYQHHPSPTCHHGVTGLGPHGVGPPAAGLRWGYSSPPVTLTPMVFTQAQPPSPGAGAALGDKRT